MFHRCVDLSMIQLPALFTLWFFIFDLCGLETGVKDSGIRLALVLDKSRIGLHTHCVTLLTFSAFCFLVCKVQVAIAAQMIVELKLDSMVLGPRVDTQQDVNK